MLTISSEKNKKREKRDNENYYRKEFSYQSFSDLLIFRITRMKINANYKDGILHVAIAKRRR
jgi:HSP20 family protein